jgi:hypothetical protein
MQRTLARTHERLPSVRKSPCCCCCRYQLSQSRLCSPSRPFSPKKNSLAPICVPTLHGNSDASPNMGRPCQRAEEGFTRFLNPPSPLAGLEAGTQPTSLADGSPAFGLSDALHFLLPGHKSKMVSTRAPPARWIGGGGKSHHSSLLLLCLIHSFVRLSSIGHLLSLAHNIGGGQSKMADPPCLGVPARSMAQPDTIRPLGAAPSSLAPSPLQGRGRARERAVWGLLVPVGSYGVSYTLGNER